MAVYKIYTIDCYTHLKRVLLKYNRLGSISIVYKINAQVSKKNLKFLIFISNMKYNHLVLPWIIIMFVSFCKKNRPCLCI